MQQKVQLAAALQHEPDLLILDEPFSGLDPVAVQLLEDLIREASERGATILLSTHLLPQAEALCDHVLLLSRTNLGFRTTAASLGPRQPKN